MSVMLLILLLAICCIAVFMMPKKVRVKVLFLALYKLYTKTRVGLLWHKWSLNRHRRLVSTGKRSPLKDKTVIFKDVAIHIVPFLKDNLAYVVVDKMSSSAAVIDPAHPEPVIKCLKSLDNVNLTAIFCTHKHWDHCGGNSIMKETFPGTPLYSTSIDAGYSYTNALYDGDVIKVGAASFKILCTPGHTLGHVTYILEGTDHHPPFLFTGDHLFVGGCGQLFEGKGTVMVDSLNLIKKQNRQALVFPGHDYALENLKFITRLAEPDNERAKQKLKDVMRLASSRDVAVPSVLSEELEYNPFLRLKEPKVIASTGLKESSISDNEVFLEVRRMKNYSTGAPIWF